MIIRQIGRGIILAFVIACGGSTGLAEDLFVDQVAPILQRRCLDCHNDGLREGELSFSNSDDLRQSGYIDVDTPSDSYLLELITPIAGHAEMPKDAEPLDRDELKIIRRWITQNAPWPEGHRIEPRIIDDRDWWSLKPLLASERTVDPSVNPVDAFITRSLGAQGLQAVEQAAPSVLLRRITYDLTGLPPSTKAMEEFLKNWERDPEATWSATVDRLLQSDHFGEKWAQHWLDLVRYAETHGFDKDKPRPNAWPYRDFVINSFNDDKPYDQFVKEQVAGDVLYAGTEDGILGLGFLAAGPWDFIGHWEVGEEKLDGRIAKHLDRDEMIAAVFNVFQSTTIQCAQCHHHKFDPIAMQDYYRLHAVFAAVDRADRVYAGLSAEEKSEKDRLEAKLNTLRKTQNTLQTKLDQQIASATTDIDHRIEEVFIQSPPQTEPPPQYGFHSQISPDARNEKWLQVTLANPAMLSEVRLIPAFDRYNDIGAGFGFPVRYRVEVSSDADFSEDIRLWQDATERDQTNPGTRTIVISGDSRIVRSIRITATQLRERRNDYHFALAEVEAIEASMGENIASTATVSAKDSIEAPVRWAKQNVIDGVFYKELNDEFALEELHRLREQRNEITKQFRSSKMQQSINRVKEQIQEHEIQLKKIPVGQKVYAATTSFPGGGKFVATEGKPRPIHLLLRGDLRSPDALMTPGAPRLWQGAETVFFEKDSWNEGDARARLAFYLTSEQNPLLWRSIVNRLWGWTFGSPLVSTANDFGRSGTTPTHPELLDFLAVQIRDDPKHSIKSILRLLLTSDAYQRSSRIDPAMSKRDAENAYCWRANRRRLTAEEYRDSLYSIAGILDHSLGGPSFQDFRIEKPEHSPHYQYHLHDFNDKASHRRSVYRFVVRSQPQPMMTTLDCADPSISIPMRDESTTALQALTYWNDRLVEYAADQFAKRMDAHHEDADQQIRFACRLVLGRGPTKQETRILKQLQTIHGNANVARVLFNMNAFVYLD
ncbi:DUF1553 domain-containing protein [Roseiconus lacunae]|uniref:DUF1553 domain-containing protein n=1 Tax=Roseiconus lacunae TaxID=2605694 RepID=UPI003087B92C|nr:DUF1553 domain-containing protein [Stieleria sp. HD01]